jgi:hypothetical protein
VVSYHQAFFLQPCMHVLPPHSPYMPRATHPPWSDQSNNIWWRLQIMKLLITQFSLGFICTSVLVSLFLPIFSSLFQIFHLFTEWFTNFTSSSILWRYSPNRALASLNICLQTFLFWAVSFQFLLHLSKLTASSFTTSSHLFLGFPAGRPPVNAAPRTFFGIRSKGNFTSYTVHIISTRLAWFLQLLQFSLLLSVFR